MSLGRPEPGSVRDQARLLQILTGLYDELNRQRGDVAAIRRIVTISATSTTTVNGTTGTVAVQPLADGRDDGGGSDGAAPGATPGTTMARVWVSTPDPSVPYGVNLGALTSGLVYGTVSGGVSTPSAVAIPAGSRVLGGDVTNFVSSDEVRVDAAFTDALMLSNAGAVTWRNLSGGTMLGATNYDQVRSFWSGNVWFLKSEKGGSGTVRSMTVDADTATLTAKGNSVDINGTSGVGLGLLAGVRSTPQVLIGGTTSVFVGAGATTPTPSAYFTSTQMLIQSDVPAQVSGGGAVWDGLRIIGAISLTGAGTTLIANSTVFNNPTITGTGAGGTVNEAATVRIAGAPIPSSITINYKYALWVGAVISRFDGTVETSMGANIASANNMTCGIDGNVFTVTGTTQINTLAFSTGQAFRAGTVLHLIFASNPTVKHKTAGTGNQFDLSGDVDYATAAGATLTVVFDGTYWKELGRSAA